MRLHPLQPGLAPDEVERLRWDTFGHRRSHSLRSCEDLAGFTKARGFVLHRPEAGLHYPSILEAAVGRPLFNQVAEERSLQARTWVQECVVKGDVVTLALLAQRETLVSPDYLGDFFVLSGLQGDVEDYQRQREKGQLSLDAHALCAALHATGRRMARAELAESLSMQGVLGSRRLEEALHEALQRMLLVIVDWQIPDVASAEPQPVVDLLPRACPGSLEPTASAADAETAAVARQRILLRYLRNVLVEGSHEMARVLGWPAAETHAALQALEERQEVQQHPSSRHNRWIYQAVATDLLA